MSAVREGPVTRQMRRADAGSSTRDPRARFGNNTEKVRTKRIESVGADNACDKSGERTDEDVTMAKRAAFTELRREEEREL